MKQLINQVKPHIALYTDPDTGLAWVENGAAGIAHSAHPNIDATGSVAGMKDRGYWGREDRTVASPDSSTTSTCSSSPTSTTNWPARTASAAAGTSD
ncbi:hypothetical protein [Mycolicibacterium fortuitum]|uniref:hypothetical protein n=1 Tax=Mycolicibacterium fortuitum TaxID=1766 RepID=UPI0026076F2B|nr:hypothetical protein [Mycolicibacterium fortuitum]